jgi:hypothetical protein
MLFHAVFIPLYLCANKARTGLGGTAAHCLRLSTAGWVGPKPVRTRWRGDTPRPYYESNSGHSITLLIEMLQLCFNRERI